MNRNWRRAVLALVLVAFAGCGSRATSERTTAPATGASAAPSPAAGPTATIFPIGITASRVGRQYVYLTKQKQNHKVYVLRADAEKGHYFGADTGRSVFVNPHITFYASDGKRLIADAPTGTVVEKDKTVLMSGGVRARDQQGLKLRSDTLRYNDETDVLHGEGNVTVTSPRGEELQGETLDWNLHDGSINVAGAH